MLLKDLSFLVYIEDVYEIGDVFEYDVYRVKYGICEGVDEIFFGSVMLFEYNLVYLNGGKCINFLYFGILYFFVF